MTTTAPQFDGHGSGAEHRTTGTRAWCFECKEWCYPEYPCGSSSCCSEKQSPRSWSLPAEPGPEVKAVRCGGHGGNHLWLRPHEAGTSWRSYEQPSGRLVGLQPWADLLKIGPVTDASAEVS